MRILYVSRGLGSPKYGAERISEKIMRYLETKVDLYCLTDDKTFTGKGKVFFNPTFHIKIPFFEYVFYRILGKWKIRKVCNKFHPDLILSSAYSGYAIPSPKNTKTVIFFHDEPGFVIKDDISPFLISLLFRIWYKTLYVFKKSVIKKRYLYFSISQNMTRYLTNLGVEKSRVFTLPYGIISNFSNQIEIRQIWKNIQEKYNLKNNDFLLLFVGAIYYTKGLHTVIEALRIANNKNLKLLIVGSEMPFFGKFYKRRIKTRIDKYNLKEQVKWLGYVNNEILFTLYKRSTALISSSYSEGCQLTLLEAANAKLPIIATRVGSAVEQFSKQAHFFDPGDVQELAKIISTLSESELHKVEYNLYSFDEGMLKLFHWMKSIIKDN